MLKKGSYNGKNLFMEDKKMINLSKGIERSKGSKIVLAGVPGIGKSTLANKAPGSVTVDVEDGSKLLDVVRVDHVPATYDELVNILRELFVMAKTGSAGIKNVVIDTIDKVEELARIDICMKANVKSIEGIGYGKGWTMLMERMVSFLSILDNFTQIGVNVTAVCHTSVVHTDLPDNMSSYDAFALNLSKKVRPEVVKWADALLFMSRDVVVVKSADGGNKAVSESRTLVCESTPAYPDCKNRFNLGSKVPATFESIEKCYL